MDRKLFSISLLLALTTPSLAQIGGQCKEPVLPKNQIEFVEQITGAMKKKESGNTEKCENFSGTFTSSQNPKTSIHCQDIPNSTLALMQVPSEISFIQECLKTINGKSELSLILKRKGKLLSLSGRKFTENSMLPESSLLSAYLQNSKSTQVENLTLNDQSTEIKFSKSGQVFRFDSLATINRFSKDHSHSITNAADFLNNQETRVPPEMYELNHDPAFIQARKEDHFSKMLDLIYAKALKIAHGDPFNAAFISLLSTDVRNRGPCGAVFGLRGRTLVPRSIFDHELSSIIEPNHLDATQHFFGYTLMRMMTGGSLSGAISKVSKEKDFMFPILTNKFQKFHAGDNENKAVNDDVEPGISYIFGKVREQERRRIDVDRDLYYNELGIKFAKAQMSNKNAKPSETINHVRESQTHERLGLKMPNYPGAWMAYDPNRETPIVMNQSSERWAIIQSADDLKNRQRAGQIISKNRLQHDYSGTLVLPPVSNPPRDEDATRVERPDSRGRVIFPDATQPSDEDIEFLRDMCRSTDKETAIQICRAYEKSMKLKVDELWQKYH